MAGRLEVPHRRLWLAVAYVLVALLATVGATLGQSMLTAIRADGWPRHSATVVKSEVGQSQKRFTRRRFPDIEFRYVIQNVSYTTSTLSAMDAWCITPKLHETMDRFPRNAVLEIAVNPDDPAEAYVQTGFRWAHLASALHFLPLVSLLGYAWLASLRRVPQGATVVGPFLAYVEPLPRLVLVRTTIAQIGLLGMTIFGVFATLHIVGQEATDPTWDGYAMIPPGLNPGPGDLRSSIIIAVAGSAAAGLVACAWRLIRQRRFGLELIVDTRHRALIFPKPLLRRRALVPVREIKHLAIQPVISNVEGGELTHYELWLISRVRPPRRFLNCRVAADAHAVTRWINASLEAGGCKPIAVDSNV